MSAPERKAQPSEVDKLMKSMGSPSWNPIPPDHHHSLTDAEESPSIRMLGWMLDHTIHWGHRSPYAINKEGRELHLEHAAADLDMDDGNARRCWREGVARGRWRNGSKAEGPRRLYLCGRVRRIKLAVAPEEESEKVCTDLYTPDILKQIKSYPPYIWEQAQRLPEQERLTFLTEDARDARLQKDIEAELAAARRVIFNHRQDNRYERFHIDKIREVHKSKLTPEELAARETRLSALCPVIERYVQTFEESVQSQEESQYEGDSANVQTAAPRSTLLGSEPPEKPQDSGVRATLIPPPSPPQSTHRDGEESDGLLPAPKQPAAAKQQARSTKNPGSRKSNGEEAETPALKNPGNGAQPRKPARGDATDERLGQYLASHPPADTTQADILYRRIPELQKRYENAPFSKPKFSALGKGDQQLVKLILTALAGDDANEFMDSVEGRCERGDVQSLGLFLDLAKVFHAAAPERAKRRAEWEAEERRQAGITARAKERTLRQARSILASKDPTVTERDRELAREVVNEADGKSKGAGS